MFEMLGGLFDFDGDGIVELDEALIGFSIFDDMMNVDEEKDPWDDELDSDLSDEI